MVSSFLDLDLASDVVGKKLAFKRSSDLCSDNSCGTAACSSCGHGC